MKRIKIKSKKRLAFSLVLILLVMIIVGSLINGLFQHKVFYPVKYWNIIEKEASKYDIDPYLVLSVIKAESNFDEHVVSSQNAVGLMQLQLETAKWCAGEMNYDKEITRADLFDPKVNISIGVWYIDYLEAYYEDMQLALIAYNAGIGNVDKWLENEHLSDGVSLVDIPFEETKGYVTKINTYYDWYKNLYVK